MTTRGMTTSSRLHHLTLHHACSHQLQNRDETETLEGILSVHQRMLGRILCRIGLIALLISSQSSAYVSLRPLISRCTCLTKISLPAKGYNQRNAELLAVMDNNDESEKWEILMEDENGEKLESVKAAVFSAIGGSLAVIPYALIKGALLHFNSEWEFNIDGLLILTAPLFGITYRYAIRRDNNPNLKQGVIGAFVITRAVATVKVADICTSIPLNCGPPFYFFTDDMLKTGLEHFFEAGLCFAGSAYLMETLFKSKILSKFPKMK